MKRHLINLSDLNPEQNCSPFTWSISKMIDKSQNAIPVSKVVLSTITLKTFLKETPVWQKQMKLKIEGAKTPDELMSVWMEGLKPYVLKAWLNAGAAARGIKKVTTLNKKLTKMVGPDDCSILMSNLSSKQEFEGLGLVNGISKILKGEMSHERYIEKYGHRGAHEYELSLPVDTENREWIESQVKAYETLDIDVDKMLESQRKKFDDAFVRFIVRYPNKIMWLKKQLKTASENINLRERGHSEFMRVYRLVRQFALKAGHFSKLGEEVFFLYVEDVEEMLSGRGFNKDLIPNRRTNYEKNDSIPNMEMENTDLLIGIPGAAGSVKGIVRIVNCFEDSDQLLPGEILVTSTTNIGWTTIFPKVSAIITDVGVPLSHTAIFARAMGIPAVVGCDNATLILKTGDKIKVDGGQGTVEIL